jgi:prophage regulatory protein
LNQNQPTRNCLDSASASTPSPRLLYNRASVAADELSISAPPTNRRKFLRLPQVKESTGLSRTSIYRKIATHEFPRPVRLGPKSVAWIEGEIQQWMSGLELSRDREMAL